MITVVKGTMSNATNSDLFVHVIYIYISTGTGPHLGAKHFVVVQSEINTTNWGHDRKVDSVRGF